MQQRVALLSISKTSVKTYFVTHWQPQAPAREYRVADAGKTLAKMRARARVGATLWLVDTIDGVIPARRIVEVTKSLPTELATIFFSFPATCLQI